MSQEIYNPTGGERRCASWRMGMVAGVAMVALMAASWARAQETRRTIAHQAPPGGEPPNSSAVPDVYAVTGHFDRVVVLRFKYKADLLAGLTQMVKQEHIESGVILAGVGSVRGYQLHQVSNRTLPSKNTFETNLTEGADIVSMNGYIMNGAVHPHITLATPDRVIAGHLEPGTEVFTFAMVTIGVMNDVNFSRMEDSAYR
jgi:predicted DNA-binding protein with PD1-like motif